MGVIFDSRNGATSVFYVDDSAPTYAELESRVKSLEAEVAQCRQTIEDLALGTCEECQPNWKQPK